MKIIKTFLILGLLAFAASGCISASENEPGAVLSSKGKLEKGIKENEKELQKFTKTKNDLVKFKQDVETCEESNSKNDKQIEQCKNEILESYKWVRKNELRLICSNNFYYNTEYLDNFKKEVLFLNDINNECIYSYRKFLDETLGFVFRQKPWFKKEFQVYNNTQPGTENEYKNFLEYDKYVLEQIKQIDLLLKKKETKTTLAFKRRAFVEELKRKYRIYVYSLNKGSREIIKNLNIEIKNIEKKIKGKAFLIECSKQKIEDTKKELIEEKNRINKENSQNKVDRIEKEKKQKERDEAAKSSFTKFCESDYFTPVAVAGVGATVALVTLYKHFKECREYENVDSLFKRKYKRIFLGIGVAMALAGGGMGVYQVLK
ncbi:hypothetical protein KAU11_04725 [Candidatus Babeliales bacterium]|nr:hypothetical protein [Candidatus Babeliales bacterium]